VDAADLLAGRSTDAILRLLQFEAARARAYYDESRPLIGMVQKGSRPGLRALIAIYSRLLERIEASNFDVFSRRVSLPAVEKCWLVLRARASR